MWLHGGHVCAPDRQPHGDLTPSSSFQIKVWTANPQQFVEDEDDDTFSYTVRIAAQDLLLVRGLHYFCRVIPNLNFPAAFSTLSPR